MIKVEKPGGSEPAVLERRDRRQGKTENEKAIDAYEKLAPADRSDPKSYKFKFELYRHDDIKQQLTELFSAKCAYCESRYAGTQPMDVEHWRPKGEVHLENGDVLMGYYWLASDWDNLLPSCIDCNRSRRQYDVVREQEITIGKANQFPVAGDHLVTQDLPHLLPEDREKPLLLHPCLDEPAEHIEFGEKGEVRPVARDGEEDIKGRASIDVFALNRSGLVQDRLEVIRQIQQRVHTISALIGLLDQLGETLTEQVSIVLEDLLSYEMDELLAYREPQRPFAQLARQLIHHYIKQMGLETE